MTMLFCVSFFGVEWKGTTEGQSEACASDTLNADYVTL